MLGGDASLDPRNYLGLGDFDFVPTRIVETAAFKTASDDWFSDFKQTGFPIIAVFWVGTPKTFATAQLRTQSSLRTPKCCKMTSCLRYHVL